MESSSFLASSANIFNPCSIIESSFSDSWSTAFPPVSRTDKSGGARTVQILQPSFERFSRLSVSTGTCRRAATARPDLDKIDT
jgi:hypothetical protein